MAKANQLGVGDPILPRRRREPIRYDETHKEFYRRQYFEIADKVVGKIERRFEAPKSVLYTKVERMFKTAAEGQHMHLDTIQEINNHFGDDVQEDLHTKLSIACI